MLYDTQYQEACIIRARAGHSARGTASLLVILVVLAIGGYYYRDIFANISREHASEADAKELEVQDAISRKAVAQELEIKLEPIHEEMNQLSLQAQSFNAQVEAIVGVPFEVADIRSTRRLNDAILTSDPFAEAWTQLLRARITPQMLEQRRYLLTEIDQRVESQTASKLDQQHLEEVRRWIQHAQQQLQQHNATLVRLRNHMTAASRQP